MTLKHYLSVADFDLATHEALIDRAMALRTAHAAGQHEATLKGKTLAMLFEQASER